jgi:YbbR domain-containing protein
MRSKRYQIIGATTLFAVVLWVSVNLSSQYQTTVAVPIVVTNAPQGLALRTPLPASIQLTLSGEGWQMASYLWRSELRYLFDLTLANVYPKIRTQRDVRRALEIPPGISVVEMKPESLFMAFEPYVAKKVPVLLDTSVSYAEGYGLSGVARITPESTIVGGAASVVNAVDHWRTRKLNLRDLKAAVDMEIGLDDSVPFLLTFQPQAIRLRMNVQPLAEKTLSGITVASLSVPSDREVILIPPKIEIVVRGGIDQLTGISTADCRAFINFEEIPGDTSRTLVPRIELPAGLTLIEKRPERLHYVIRKRLQ